MSLRKLTLGFLMLCLGACSPVDPDESDEDFETDDDAVSSGVNGSVCIASPYNCSLRAQGGNRVNNAQDNSWTVDDSPVVDGNGDSMGMNTRDHLTFNYGQTRRIGNVTYAFALSTSTSSAGWVPMNAIVSEEIFRDRVGEVNAKGAGLKKMACYEVKNSHDTSRELLKVVYDSKDTHERAGDYMPLVRKNGRRYVNLPFVVPGFALGGTAVDIFPAGTKYQRLDVPTTNGPPSIDVPLWKKDSAGRYRARAGDMKFVYGYVKTKPGAVRYGWMAYESIKPSSGCQ